MIRPRVIAPDVELFPTRTPTLPPATHTNSYAIGAREVILVEPAPPYADEQRAWRAWAEGVAAQGRTLVGIFLTHHHVDHASGSRALARALDLPLFAHPWTIANVRGLDDVPTIAVDDGHAFVLDGPRARRWEVLHTPGHAPGHLCLHDRDARTLIAGDMVANGSTILIPPDDGGDMAEYLVQLGRLDALDTTLVLPAHGEPLDDPRATFSYYLAHRKMREEKVFTAWHSMSRDLGRNPTLDEMVPPVYDDTSPLLWPLARGALEAHLVKLRREGRV